MSDEAERCGKCKMPLRTLVSQQRRGWVALGAGAFLMLLMGGVALWIDHLYAANGAARASDSAAQFLQKINIAFALVVVAGALGVANGWMMAHSGRRNTLMLIGMIAFFAAGLFLAANASNGYQP